MTFGKDEHYYCDGGCGRIIKTPLLSLTKSGRRKKFSCLSEKCKKIVREVQHERMRNRIYFRCSTCKKKFSRRPSEIARGKVFYCSKKCRYGSIKAKSRRLIVLMCTLCGIQFERLESESDAKTPFCSHLCRQIYQDEERAISQLIYTPDLLHGMMEHDREICAFPGCTSLQYHHNNPRFQNPFHACNSHRKKIRQSLRDRLRKRNAILREAGISQSNKEIIDVTT